MTEAVQANRNMNIILTISVMAAIFISALTVSMSMESNDPAEDSGSCEVHLVLRGMTSGQVETICGTPTSIHQRNEMAGDGSPHHHEQWVYGSSLAKRHQDIYFTNGAVSDWQDWRD